MTCKWLRTMASKSPKSGYSTSKWPQWLINGGDPNYLLSGMIFQAVSKFISHLGHLYKIYKPFI